MALGNCDACGERPVAFMLSNTANGNTQGLCDYCLIVFSGQLAEALGLTEAPSPDSGATGDDGSPGPGADPPPPGPRGRRRGAGDGPEAPPAPPGESEEEGRAPANAG